MNLREIKDMEVLELIAGNLEKIASELEKLNKLIETNFKK